MIGIRGLTKSFGRLAAVEGVSFDVARGEAVALWGPNGAGKTTIIRCLLGLLRYRGEISVCGRDLRRAGKAARLAIGYVPQELAFHNDVRVREALRFFGRLKRAGPPRVEAVVDEVGLGDHARKRIGELSGGMKQRLALAIALLADPPILVLDELTSNLDLDAQSGFLGLLCGLKARGKTVLFASHRLEEIELLADRVVALAGGRIEAQCAPARLADAIGLRCVMRLRVDDDAVVRAAETLRRHQYSVSMNGRGLTVEVPAAHKAGPIQALLEERIAVHDIELPGNGRSRGEGGPDRDR